MSTLTSIPISFMNQMLKMRIIKDKYMRPNHSPCSTFIWGMCWILKQCMEIISLITVHYENTALYVLYYLMKSCVPGIETYQSKHSNLNKQFLSSELIRHVTNLLTSMKTMNCKTKKRYEPTARWIHYYLQTNTTYWPSIEANPQTTYEHSK